MASLIVLLLGGVARDANGQWIEQADMPSPLVESEPFDLITLATDNILLKVVPLREPPTESLPGTGNLIFEYVSDSEGLLTVAYSQVKSYQTFQQLLMQEAEDWMAAKDFGRAFRNLLWLYDNGAKSDPKVGKLLRTCLFQDGLNAFKNNNYELALSIFEDVFQRDPGFQVPGINRTLIQIVMECYDKIVAGQFEAEEYSTVRVTLESVAKRYPKNFEGIADRWRKKFSEKSDALLDEARGFARSGEGRQAHLAVRQAEQITPGSAKVQQLLEEMLDQFPLIVVGVNQPASDANPQRFDHWGARRVGRLTQRTIVELVGVSEEGGKYKFLNGELARKDLDGYEYQFTIDPELTAFGAPPATPFDIAVRLGALADPQSSFYSESWAKVVDSIAIDNETQVTVKLRRAFVRPEALIDITYQPPGESGQPQQDGVYVLTSQDEQYSTFDLNPLIERDPQFQHPVVAEQQFTSASDAVTELLKGNIDIVDRVPVSDLPRLKRKPGVQARAYLIPTVHMLLPKIRGELEKNSSFRRGLSHAIDRETILKEVICAGQQINGCEVISGPLPIGTEENDQISYAYNFKVRPPAFNVDLAQTLMQMALTPQRKKSSSKEGETGFQKKIPMPKLVLAHPRSTSAANACFSIAAAWNKAGVVTSTRVLEPGESYPPDDRWDLLYVEVSMEEPLADIARLVGSEGFAEDVSAPVDQTLADLGYTQTWQSACSNLRLLHQQLATDLSVIPLWQLKEHFAYRTTVRNIGRDLVHLYQNIQRWRIDIRPEEEETE